MPTISDFKSQMVGGGARPNQFVVHLTFPNLVGSLRGNALRASQFLCRAASLPVSTVEDITASYRGRPVHFAGERIYQPWSISVLNDTDFTIRDAFEKWHEGILNYGRTNGETFPGGDNASGRGYQTDMEVWQVSRNSSQPLKSYKFHDAYPTNIGEIQLAFDQNSQIEEFTVDFMYNFFIPSNIDAQV